MSYPEAYIEDNVLVVERKDRRGSAERREIPHMESIDGKDFLDKAKEVLHDVAEKTMEFAHEVKEKLIGHVTDNEIEKAAERVTALKNRLMYEQYETRDLQEQINQAEKAQNLGEYKQLKEKESKLKHAERTTEIKIQEATDEYEKLKNAQLNQKMEEKLHQKCHDADRKAINADILQEQLNVPSQLSAH
uniref:Uncharacterized protein n=1 Tax=Plectus sambesii TaxID=2011161 RepID=A0A914XLP1_9BILA